MGKRYFSMCVYALLSLGLLFAGSAVNASSCRAAEQIPYNIHMFPNSGIFVFYAQVAEGDMPSFNGDHRWSIALDQPGADVLISMVIGAGTAGTLSQW